MQTIETNDLVSATFEACSEFGRRADGSPVCAACGWLETEHDHIAEVRVLARARNEVRAPKRLAS